MPRLPSPGYFRGTPKYVDTVSIGLRSANVRGARGIKTALSHAYQYIVHKWVEVMAGWADLHVPARTGNLKRQTLSAIRSSTWDALVVGSPGVPYAGYVNEMAGVNWTRTKTPDPLPFYYTKLRSLGWQIISPIVRQAIRSAGLEALTGLGAAQLETEFWLGGA